MLELIAEKQGPQHDGEELKESEEQKAQRLVGEMLREAGWKEQELERRGKGTLAKARMAARLRAETTMTWSWIAKRLEMGIGARRPMRCDGAVQRPGLAVPSASLVISAPFF